MSFVHFSENPKICGACSENGAKQISLEVFALHLKEIVIDLVTGGCEDRLETTFAKYRTLCDLDRIIACTVCHYRLVLFSPFF
jgi:hypothetical protein